MENKDSVSWMQALKGYFPDVAGKKRTLTGFWAVLFTLSGVFMGAWYMYTSGFGIVSTETNRAYYLLFTSILVFLLYPATKWSPKDRPQCVGYHLRNSGNGIVWLLG